jgi:transposase
MGLLNPIVMAATFPAGTAQRMKELLGQAEDTTELRRIQSVLLGALGMPAKEISVFVGYHKNYIHQFWSRFREEGEASLKSERGGGNRNRAHLSLEEEEHFLQPFLDKAEKGGVLIVDRIHKAYGKKLGKTVHHSVVYRLLHRHGWRKIAPRPAHPKGNSTDQEIFKVSFPPQSMAGKS